MTGELILFPYTEVTAILCDAININTGNRVCCLLVRTEEAFVVVGKVSNFFSKLSLTYFNSVNSVSSLRPYYLRPAEDIKLLWKC